jgi:hypothetical protein
MLFFLILLKIKNIYIIYDLFIFRKDKGSLSWESSGLFREVLNIAAAGIGLPARIHAG